MATDYDNFKQIIFRKTGINLDDYKQQQMHRRLRGLVERAKVSSFAEYLPLLEGDPLEYQRFLDRITINVSEFFRNPEKFSELKQIIIPQLLQQNRNLRIWSAGCSSGEEPYSLAILLEEADPAGPWQITATDLDETMLRRSQEGTYQAKQLANVSPQLREKYLTPDGGIYRVRNCLKAKITFSRHNLLTDPYPENCDLILCRNVLIYFTDAAKAKVYPRFVRALRPGGFFVTGNTESIFNPERYGLTTHLSFIYRKNV
ncbi:MAG: CheR family methyltransferase [bacterium]